MDMVIHASGPAVLRALAERVRTTDESEPGDVTEKAMHPKTAEKRARMLELAADAIERSKRANPEPDFSL